AVAASRIVGFRTAPRGPGAHPADGNEFQGAVRVRDYAPLPAGRSECRSRNRTGVALGEGSAPAIGKANQKAKGKGQKSKVRRAPAAGAVTISEPCVFFTRNQSLLIGPNSSKIRDDSPRTHGARCILRPEETMQCPSRQGQHAAYLAGSAPLR